MDIDTTIPYSKEDKVFNLAHFFELSPDLLCIAGFDGYFKKINPAVSKTLGYTNSELLARPIDDFVYHDDRTITSTKRKTIIRDNPLLNFENRYVTKTGDIVWLSWTSMPIQSEKVVFAIAKNITHKKQLEADRNAMLGKLSTINNDLKQLTLSTSHDLRLPVSNLLSVFSMLDVTKIQDEETLEFIDMLKSSTENLKHTLNAYVDLLSQKNVLTPEKMTVDLQGCLDSVLSSLNALIVQSKAQITIDFSALPAVNFNRAYLESIFLNLVTNSIKYAMPEHVPVIHIYTEADTRSKRLIFADEGQGFDLDEVKGKIFGLNQKFHAHSDSQGIGLYLVHNYVTSMGGHIDVESRPGQGTRFTIRF